MHGVGIHVRGGRVRRAGRGRSNWRWDRAERVEKGGGVCSLTGSTPGYSMILSTVLARASATPATHVKVVDTDFGDSAPSTGLEPWRVVGSRQPPSLLVWVDWRE
jgi:hypothetical protein